MANVAGWPPVDYFIAFWYLQRNALRAAIMRHHRFLGDFDLSQHDIEITDLRIIHQIANVLRMRVGDEVILVAQSHGQEARVRITGITKTSLICLRESDPCVVPEPVRTVTLFMSILKKENYEFVVEKATEIGVRTIVPIITRRTVKFAVKKDRLQKIACEAAEQSGRGSIPDIKSPITFEDALAIKSEHAANFFFDIGGEPYSRDASTRSPHVFIGPEGGWDDKERDLARRAGLIRVELGRQILRAETAAIVASYLAVQGLL